MIDQGTAEAILSRLERALAPPGRALRPLSIDKDVVGWLDDMRSDRLAAFSEVFTPTDQGIAFLPALADQAARSRALAGVTRTLGAEGALTSWRNELYAVAPAFGAPPWFRLERAAARYFGVHTFAVHVNGVVRAANTMRMWFARRSPGKAIDPLMLDNLVGGGVAAGAHVDATLRKEAWEEAGIPAALAACATSAGTLHILREQPDGLQSETIFVHDLWLPGDFAPANQDAEAIEHRLVDLEEAARLIALADGPDRVTADASLVVLDFLLRHGTLGAATATLARLHALGHAQAAWRRT